MELLREQWRKVTAGQVSAALREGEERFVGGFRLVYTTRDHGETKPRHVITAYDATAKVGEMVWIGRTGEVWGIEVTPAYRRQGLATAMWQFAQEAPKKPKHSNQRTDDGEAWARSVGGPVPRRLHAARGEVMGDTGFWVEDVEIRGMSMTGTVVEGTGWREVLKVGKTAMALPDFKRTDDVEQMMDAYLDVIPSNDAAIIRSKRPKVVRHESAPRNAPSFAWYDGSNNTLNFLPGPITQDLISHEMTHALDALSGWISMTTAYKALCRGIRSGALTPQEVFVDAYMAAHFSGKQGVWFDGLPDDQRRGLIEIATNVARAASVLRTAMSLPDFKRTDRDMSEKQFISACKKILADVAKEMGFKGKLPEVVIQDLGGSSARSIDPGEMREFPNGAILVDPYDADSARQKDSGYSTFRVIAHEAIHALVQREMKSYAGSTQIITEGSAEILSVVYWAKNGPGYGGGGSKDLDAIHEQGYGWVGGDVALTSRINYPEYIVEVLRRAASKVGWDQKRIVAEVKRIASSDRNAAIDWLRETSADHPLPGGMPKTAEGMLLWLVRGA